jgi:putative phosphoribosyl transferase
MSDNLNRNTLFKDSDDAARKLLDAVPKELFSEFDTVVVGVSEGGVFYADKIARTLHAKFDILLTEPIVAPNNSEVPIAMISETEEVVLHKALVEAFDINEDYIFAEAQRKYEEEVIAYVYKYRKGGELTDLKGKYVILVDECIETGLTMMVALKSVIARGAKNIYIATPVLDKAVYENLLAVCDDVFCPYKIENYISIEYYFEIFESMHFEEIEAIIAYYESQKNEIKEAKDTING